MSDLLTIIDKDKHNCALFIMNKLITNYHTSPLSDADKRVYSLLFDYIFKESDFEICGLAGLLKERTSLEITLNFPEKTLLSWSCPLHLGWRCCKTKIAYLFRRYLAAYKTSMSSKNNANADALKGLISSLGTQSVGYLIPAILAGERGLISELAYLTDNELTEKSTDEVIKAWWQKNKNSIIYDNTPTDTDELFAIAPEVRQRADFPTTDARLLSLFNENVAKDRKVFDEETSWNKIKTSANFQRFYREAIKNPVAILPAMIKENQTRPHAIVAAYINLLSGFHPRILDVRVFAKVKGGGKRTNTCNYFAEMITYDKLTHTAIINFWWERGIKFTAQNFSFYYDQYRRLQKSNAEKYQEWIAISLIEIERLGLAVIPSLIANLDTDIKAFRPIIARLTGNSELLKMNSEQLKEWWKVNAPKFNLIE